MDKAQLKEIINKYDPVGLLAMGAPEDEYDGEVEAILLLVSKEMGWEAFCEAVQSVFDKRFGSDIATKNKDKITHVAQAVLVTISQ